MKLSDQLKAAYQLIGAGKDQSKWVQEVGARNAAKHSTSSLSEDAVCFCSWGAIERTVGGNDARIWQLMDVFHCVPQIREWGGMISYNDSHTYAEVCAAWERAIAKAEASESCPT